MPTRFLRKLSVLIVKKNLGTPLLRKHKLVENGQLVLDGRIKINQNVTFSGNCEIHNDCEIGIGSVLTM